jgi:3-dehydroquinate dehydratase/shikimate dehydrogenase
MKNLIALKTDRLLLREWQESDFEPFANLNADPRVMEYFPSTLSKEKSDEMAKRIQKELKERGWGLWAVSLITTSQFIGFIGLNPLDKATFPVPFTPAVEIGWRLSFDFWGKGYASEGARRALEYGFETLHLKEIVSFTAVQNKRSRRVMEQIGMHHDPKNDFDHPKIPEGNWLRKHVLYKIQAKD